MYIPAYLIVLLSILSLFPVLAVGTWLFLRQEAMRNDVATAVHKVELMHKDYTLIINDSAQIKSSFADVTGKLQAADLRAEAFAASLRTVQNKAAVMERIERKARKEADREEEAPETDEILQKHGLPLFQQEPAAAMPPPLKRQFGVMPK